MHNSGNTIPILSVHFIHKALCLSGKAEVIAPSLCHGVFTFGLLKTSDNTYRQGRILYGKMSHRSCRSGD